MPAKALVPVEALPCIHRFRGHGPLLQVASFTAMDGPTTVEAGDVFVGAGHARESVGSG